jgi:orotate phosphoribosyltransferase-like protein
MISKTEKQQRVIELYQQGKTVREIAQEVHMSFGDIGFIIKKATGPEDDNNNITLTTLSKDSQARNKALSTIILDIIQDNETAKNDE